MSTNKYESSQLNSVLESLFKKKASGILSLKTQVNSWQSQRSCILVLRNGDLVYGGTKLPSNQELSRGIKTSLGPDFFNAALSVAIERMTAPSSVRELLELLITMKAFTWQTVETSILTKLVLILEQFYSHPGEATWQETNDFDLSYGKDKHGLSWSDIQKELDQRQQKWSIYAPKISSMDAIPFITSQQLQKIDNSQVKKHLAANASGNQTLVNIAEKMGKDPLKIAKNYFDWSEKGWVGFNSTSEANQAVIEARAKIKSIQAGIQSNGNRSSNSLDTPVNTNQLQDNSNLPTVLSVDDSPIIQTTIKRALKEKYNVLLAGKATEALKILNQQPVKLLLLDLTMPDVDGLEFCKTIRKIPKFQDLPIIMVTARDGLMNKMKGHIAGTSKYLTKPFSPEQLREVVHEYISQ